jgi:hypothetical protein
MLHVFEKTTFELQHLNVKHVLVGGGVLGYARDGQLPLYDEDVDMYVEESFWKTPLMKQFIKTLNVKYGFVSNYKDFGLHLSISYSTINNHGIGMWPMKKKDNFLTIYHYTTIDQPYDNIFPLKYVNFMFNCRYSDSISFVLFRYVTNFYSICASVPFGIYTLRQRTKSCRAKFH